MSGDGEGYGGVLGNEDGGLSGGAQDGIGGQDPNSLVQPVLNGTPVFQHLLFNFLDTQVRVNDRKIDRKEGREKGRKKQKQKES